MNWITAIVLANAGALVSIAATIAAWATKRGRKRSRTSAERKHMHA